MTHYKLNRILLGVGAFYAVLVVAAAFFGPDSSSSDVLDVTPGFDETVSDDGTPHTGMGGVPAERTVIAGTVVDTNTGNSLSDVSVVAETDGRVQSRTRTGEDGAFELENVAETATISFSHDEYHTEYESADVEGDYAVELASTGVSGRIINVDGSPIRGATVAAGESFTRSVENGDFQLEDVPEDADLIVKAGGYETLVVPRSEFSHGFTLSGTSVQAVYANANVVADEERFGELLDMVERTDLNAVAIDIKNTRGELLYDSELAIPQEIDAVQPRYDVDAVLQELEDRGIQAIARMVVFEDAALAEARTDLAIMDAVTDEPWRTWQGNAWTNPYSEEVWDYNASIMQEAVERGFDEIQLSHVRFPDDGPLHSAEYGPANNTMSGRQRALAQFLDHAYAAIAPTEAKLGVDVFALTMWDEAALLTGQDLATIAQRVDYVHPMLFPSHFREGSLGYDVPGDHPYDMVGRSIESGMALLLSEHQPRIRPWLQGFTYDAREVREQINAVNDYGARGWMLWNSEGTYHEEALVEPDG